MAKPQDTTQPAAPVQTPATASPTEGGSYTLDDATGKRVLVSRTQPNTKPRSKP